MKNINKKLITFAVVAIAAFGGFTTGVQADAIVNETCHTVYGVRTCTVDITPKTAISVNEVAMLASGLFVAGTGFVSYSKLLKNQI